MPESFTIAGLANSAGVHVETVRYYQRLRLLPKPVRPARGVRRYTSGDSERLRFIKRAQAMGFSLGEMAALLDLKDRRSCRATREIAISKLHAIDEQIRGLKRLRVELAELLSKCASNPDDSTCPVIDRLAQRTSTL
jgi:MerR family mercuric resistance operon transcriptional regulator